MDLPLISFDRRYLAIYLNDHRAGAIGGYELAKRARSSNRGNELGDYLDQLIGEMEHEQAQLESIMELLEVDIDRAKQVLAWSGEKLGRLKFNGELTTYSPLSRLVEIEGLYLGVSGKHSMWTNLQRTMGEHLRRFGLEDLIDEAESQQDRLEDLRLDYAPDVLGDYTEAVAE